jgi:hypothetical protein
MSRYTVYPGKFLCHECKKEVFSIRFYGETKEATWMCSEKHLSSVKLYAKKTKRDYEREK